MSSEPDATSESSWNDTDQTAGLEPVRFLEGSWHGEGQGPYGPYSLDAIAESEDVGCS